MSVRLNKVARDLNVGVQTIVEFLQKKVLKLMSTPIPKSVTSSMSCLLRNSVPTKAEKESDNIGHDRQKRPTSTAKSVEHVELHSREYVKPQVIGHIDLDAPHAHGSASVPEKMTPNLTFPPRRALLHLLPL